MDTGRLRQAVEGYIRRKIKPTQNNTAKVGTLHGNRVSIGSRSYDYDSTVYEHINDGSQVYCLLTDDGKKAVIVGVK